MMNKIFIQRAVPITSSTSHLRRRLANDPINHIRGFKSGSQLLRSGSRRSVAIGCHYHDQLGHESDTITCNWNGHLSRKTLVRVRNYHHKGPSSYHDSIADDDSPSSTAQKPGSKAFILESDRLALVDLFRKHASPEDPQTLDREALGLVLEAVGETPDEKTLDRIFRAADLDGNGAIDLEEFLTSSDAILGSVPAGMILVIGGPGSGKGLLSKRLVEECGVVHISSGDLLREEVARDTDLGRKVHEIMIRGDLVSSAVIVTLMRRKMRLPENAGKRVLLDGFPRSPQNAKDLVELCGQPELALHLRCDDTVLIERILKRKEEALNGDDNGNTSDEGSTTKGRDDDNIKIALRRLRNYHKYLHVTIDFLRENHVPVVNLDCDCPPDQVWEQLLAIGKLMRPATTIDNDSLTILPGIGNRINGGSDLDKNVKQ